jgi:CheY-like chemotaxis protein
LIEDEPWVRIDIAHQLRSAGFAVLQVVGELALNLLQSSNSVDLIVTELTPRIDGAALVREIRARFPHVPIFLCAGCLQSPKWLRMAADSHSAVEGTVLLVEHEILIRHVVAAHLRGCRYAVVEAATADEALPLLRHGKIDVDVVLSDVEMPGIMDGLALAKWLRANRPDVGVILVGTVADAIDAADELCEASTFPKPYEPQVAADHIRRLLASRSARDKRASI